MMKTVAGLALLAAGARAQIDASTPQSDDRPLLWSDEFDGTTIDRNRWDYDIWAPGTVNHELQRYTDSAANSYVENGNLVIRAFQSGNEYTSARMRTKQFFKYGQVEVRAIVPVFEGAWPAIWSLPEVVNWPQCGEMDIMEAVACDLNEVVSTIHTGAFNGAAGTQKGGKTHFDIQQFHVYKLSWNADQVRYSADGDPAHFVFDNDHTNNIDTWPFNKPFNVILNIAVGGDWGGYCLGGRRPSFPDDGVKNVLKIDYVRIYGENYCSGPYNGFPECEARIAWMIDNWDLTKDSKQQYLNAGLKDGSRCAIQKYLNEVEGYCPELCTGPFVNDPDCAPAIDSMLATWDLTPESADYYLSNGLVDGTRCSIQQYLHTAEGKCPPVVLTFKETNNGVPRPSPPTPAPTNSCNPGGAVWNAIADGYSCGDRITWTVNTLGATLDAAKDRVAGEYPGICGACAAGPNPCSEGMSVWNAIADGYSCGDRITWVIQNLGKTLDAAKDQVALEYPSICGGCISALEKFVFTAAPTLPGGAATGTTTKDIIIYALGGAGGLVVVTALAVYMFAKRRTPRTAGEPSEAVEESVTKQMEMRESARMSVPKVPATMSNVNPMFANDDAAETTV